MKKIIECEVCHKLFMATNGRSRYCSPECRAELKNEQKKARRRMRREGERYKPQMTIEEINSAALAEHLSYGQYVAKYNL